MDSPRTGEGYLPSFTAIKEFRRHPSGALQGFVTIETSSGFTIHGIAVFNQAGNRWLGLPNKPRINKGKIIKSNAGGLVVDPVIEIKDKERKRAFDSQVLKALDAYIAREVQR